MTEDTRDRMIALEVEVRHLSSQLDAMGVKLDQVHEAFTQAKGAKWVLASVAGVAGLIAGFLAAWAKVTALGK